MRSETNEDMTELLDKLRRVAENVAEAYGAKAEFNLPGGVIPAAVLDPVLTVEVAECIKEVAGEENLAEELKNPGGEDFHYFARTYPNLKAAYFGVGVAAEPGLHDPNMHFNTGRCRCFGKDNFKETWLIKKKDLVRFKYKVFLYVFLFYHLREEPPPPPLPPPKPPPPPNPPPNPPPPPRPPRNSEMINMRVMKPPKNRLSTISFPAASARAGCSLRLPALHYIPALR